MGHPGHGGFIPSFHGGWYWFVGFLFQADAMPQFKIEQTPDAVGMVAIAGAMFMKQALDSGALEEATIEAARFEEQSADYI